MRRSRTYRGRMWISQLLSEQTSKLAAHTRARRHTIRSARLIGARRTPCWSYEQPLEAVATIAGHMAFYPDRIDKLEQLPD
jgi:uncharacterized protein (DUF427 family)